MVYVPSYIIQVDSDKAKFNLCSKVTFGNADVINHRLPCSYSKCYTVI